MEIFILSKKGTIHTNNNTHCQDSYAISSYDYPIILSVADGHGGKVYCRSDIGSKLACDAAVDIIKKGDYSNLPLLIKQEYDTKVKKHFENNPLTENEIKLLANHSYQMAYGSTLLIAILFENDFSILQLGDGEIHAIDSKGCFMPALPEDEDCIASFTSSMCYPEEEAINHFRKLNYSEKPALVILYSDGYRNKYSKPYELAEAIVFGSNVSAIAQNGEHGDDQTIIVAIDRTLTETETFKKGFNETLDDYKSEIIILQKKIAKEKLENRIKEIENFLFLAETKIKESKENGDTERISRLEILTKKKNQLLKLYRDELSKLYD